MSIKIFLATLVLLGIMSFPAPAKAVVHPGGTNININGTIYFVDFSGQKRPYTSAAAFLSYGFNTWDQVTSATPEDLALPTGPFVPPQDGKIICSTGERKGTCYLITEGWKIGFVSEAQFRELGFSFSRALYGDVSFLGERQNIASGSEAHRPGVLVRDYDGTIYLMHAAGLAGFPNFTVFQSWGYSAADVVPMNNNDRLLQKFGLVTMRQHGALNPVVDWVVQPKTLNVLVPSAGWEEWIIGTKQKIFWDNTTFDPQVEIWLQQYQPPCDFGPCPLSAYPISSYALAHSKSNTGEFEWTVGQGVDGDNIPEGLYTVSIQGTNRPEISDASDYPFIIVAPETEERARDAKRVSDVRQMASALELYYNDFNGYPERLSDLSPNYFYQLPTAPTPADGPCSSTQNTYAYQRVSVTQYQLTFCLGQTAGGYGPGTHTLSEAGIN
jgi:hypothetical protein